MITTECLFSLGNSMVAQFQESLVKGFLVGQDRPSLPGSNMLHRVETESSHITVRAVSNLLFKASGIYPTCSESMAGVFYHSQAMLACDSADRFHIAGLTGQVYRK